MMDKITDETLKIKIDMEEKAVKESKELIKAYKRSLERVRKEIADIYMAYNVNGELGIGRTQRYSVLVQLEKELVKQARELGATDVEVTTKILEDVYEESYYRTAYILDQNTEMDINFAILRPEFVEQAVFMPIENEMFSDRIWKNKAKLVGRVRDDVEQAMIEGTDIRKLAREISKDFGSSIYESQRLIQNEVARCHTQASMQIYEDSGVVQKVLFNATLDELTSNICQGLDGQEFELSKAPKIPEETHVNCRSCLIPVVGGWSPIKRRDQQTGEIIEYVTYEQWAKKKNI